MLLNIIITMESQDHEGWTVVSKKTKKGKPQQNIVIEENMSDEKSEKLDTNENPDNGEQMTFPFKYNLWCHDIYNKDWSLSAYSKLCKIENVSEFWKVFNNLDKLGSKVNNFFLMKNGIDPIWEHEINRNGGVCSLKVDNDQALNIYQDLCSYMMCDMLTNDSNDINGISYSPKNSWAIIKIWNKSKSNDLSKVLNPILLTKYKDCCLRYKANEPEY